MGRGIRCAWCDRVDCDEHRCDHCGKPCEPCGCGGCEFCCAYCMDYCPIRDAEDETPIRGVLENGKET